MDPAEKGRAPPQASILLSVVIPCFEEERRIEALSAELAHFRDAFASGVVEVLLVDDGSEDGTLPRLEQLAARLARPPHFVVRVLALPENRGKGGALKAGVALSRGRMVLTLDADMATPARQLLEWARQDLIDLAEPTSETVFIASREHALSEVQDQPHRRVMGRVFNRLVRSCFNLLEQDTQCGFKLYPGQVAHRLFSELREEGWAHDVELLLRARAAGLTIISLPVRWRYQGASKVRLPRDIVAMTLAVLRLRRTLPVGGRAP